MSNKLFSKIGVVRNANYLTKMTVNSLFSAAFLCLSMAASAQQKSMETMDGQCQSNSQFTRTTEAEMKAKTAKHGVFKCKSAMIVEYQNGRVVVLFSPKDSSGSGLALGFAGTYAQGRSGPSKRDLQVDGMYFYGKEFDQERKSSKGFCEIEQRGGRVISVSCLSGTQMKGETVIIASAVFSPTSYALDASGNSAGPSAPPRAKVEPWYGVSADGSQCVPTDMSPAERIEWLRDRGVRSDAIDSAGPLINGRVPKVTIIPKSGNYPNWVYYGSREFCQEKETKIDKYR